jgi:dTDP-4-dehydrorhamnose reductase
MMKVLILGVTGMLGHKLYQVLTSEFDTTGTIRGTYNDISKYRFFRESAIVPNINALEISRVEEIIKEIGPDVVINCIGIVKSLEKTSGRLLNIWVNSLFPHQLYQCCKRKETRLIHISTDCVFSGKKGNYREDEPSDAEDIYGKTKYLGEVGEDGALTIRTSLIGRELSTSNGLVEWFLSNQGGEVNGFNNAIFTGFPTLHFARIIADVITKYPDLTGIYHVSSEPISKFELLTLAKKKMGLDIRIKEYADFVCDRSLDSTLFRTKTGFIPLPWDEMIEEFAGDAVQYRRWRE